MEAHMICELRLHGGAPRGMVASALWAGGIPVDARAAAESWGDLEQAWREAPFELLLPLAVIRGRGINAVASVASTWVTVGARELGVATPLIASACALAVSPDPDLEQCTAAKLALIEAAAQSHYHLKMAAAFVAGLAVQRLTGHAPLAKYEGYLVAHHLQQLFGNKADLFSAQSTFIADATIIARAELS
jgi:hypothetical protein